MDEREVGRRLHNKVRSLFEGFEPFLSEGDGEVDTLIFVDLVQNLEEQSASPDNPYLLTKVEELRDWVEQQPRGESAADDLLTSYFVTFVEKILEHDNLFRIAPSVVSKETLIENKDYFYQWVGPTEYHRALAAFIEVEGQN